MGHFKAVSNDVHGDSTKVFYVDDDGKETPVHSALREVKIRASANNLNEIVLIGECEFSIAAKSCEFKIAKNIFVDK